MSRVRVRIRLAQTSLKSGSGTPLLWWNLAQEHEQVLRERQIAKHGGSTMHLIGTQPPYQFWSKEDVEAGARKAAQRAALLPKRPPLPPKLAAKPEVVPRSQCRRRLTTSPLPTAVLSATRASLVVALPDGPCRMM